jgi:hypothetical protein
MVTRKFRNLTGFQRLPGLISFDIEKGIAAAGEYLSRRIVMTRDIEESHNAMQGLMGCFNAQHLGLQFGIQVNTLQDPAIEPWPTMLHHVSSGSQVLLTSK